jgi:predicted lipid-binding transport protein (Tim44 family)
LGFFQIKRIKAFLESDRPLVRWTYSETEWKQYKEIIWQGEVGDWKVQFGCLTFLLALAGMLAGMMIGLDEGFLESLTTGLVGLLLGGLFGATIGALVAGGNFWGARQAYRQSEPGQVALGANEIYANGDYFKGNGESGYIREAKIHRGNPTTLEVQLVVPPRPRMPGEEQWSIMIPSKWIERVEEILPDLEESR